MANQTIRTLLADLIRQNAATGPLPSFQSSSFVASSILNPVVQPYSTEIQPTRDIRGPSAVNRILDILSRPLYTVATPVKEFIEGERNPLELSEAAFRGLAGKEKTTGRDVLSALGLEPRGVEGFLTSLAADIVLDPTTYVGIGLAGRVGRGAARSVEALREAEEGAGLAAQSLAQDIANRAAGLAAPISRQEFTPAARPPAPTIPLRGQVQDPPRIFAAEGREPSPGALVPVQRQPQDVPTASVAGTGDTIATPIPRPQVLAHLLEEISGSTPNWRRLQQRQLSELPPDANIVTVRRAIEAQLKTVKSPVTRNMLRKQLKKLDEGIQPAHLVDATISSTMPVFPKVNLTRERIDVARAVANDFAKVNKFEEINHVGQARLYDRIFVAAQKMRLPAKARKSVILHMLRVAEDELIRQGRKFVDSEGYSIRLSDYINASGGSKALNSELIDAFRSGKPLQLVEDIKAANALVTAQEIIDPVLKTARQVRASADAAGFPPSRTVQLGNDLSRELSELAKKAGASSAEASKAKEFIRDLFDVNRDQLYSDVMQEARNLVRQSMTGRVDAHLIDRLNRKVYDALQGNPKVFGASVLQNRVVEAIMLRFATWWNAKDLRPFAREYIDTARNIAAAYHQALTPLIRSSTRTQRHIAWSVARGKMTAGSADEQELANRLKYLIEHIVGAEDVSDVAKAESVIFRAGLTMKDLNKELPPHLRFTDKTGTDALGRKFDYSNGKWMHSWKEWDLKEPTEGLYQLVRAVQLATRKNAMLDDAAARWGVPVKGGEFQYTVNAERLKGFYFPKPIADQLNMVWNRIESDKFYYGGKFLQLIDRLQRMWKSGVTIYSPSHHIRNLNGDIFLAALDGVTSVVPYRKALQVMHAFRNRYRDIEDVHNIMEADLRELALRARPDTPIVITAAGHKLTAEQVYQAAESQGFLLRAGILEDLIGSENLVSGTFGTQFAPFGGRVHTAASKLSETRDHFVRLAHFIDVLSKSKAKNLRDAIEIAGRRVKKFHPDGSDLTGFEQSVMRRLIPFYSWLRKSTPLVLEGIAMRPHISLLYPKIMADLQVITGIESEGPGDPFPIDQMFPDWIKEKGVGPIIPPTSSLAGIGRQQNWKGETPGYVVVNPTNPLLDQLVEITNPRKSVLSGLTPFLRVPGELAAGHTTLGIPISSIEGGTAGYLAQQVPLVGIGARITGQTRPDEPYHPEQLINFLTGAGVTGTGPYREQASLEIRELLRELTRRNREAMR